MAPLDRRAAVTAPANIEIEEVRSVLREMRETALGNAAVHHGTWVGNLGSVIADATNQFMWNDAPLIAIDDLVVAIRHLQRAQRILGALEGIYPTDRYLQATGQDTEPAQ